MNLDRRAAAIEEAAHAWAKFYLWAMEQPNQEGARNRTYAGPIADDILERAGISFAASPQAYREATDEVIRRGYVLAGGKADRRGYNVAGDKNVVIGQARKLRAKKWSLRRIAEKLGVSDTTVYRMLRRVA